MDARAERILLVDDNRTHLQNLAHFLRSEGYDVDEALDGNEATQHLKERTYDLLVADLVMPGVNGFRLLETKRHVAPHTPALIMSSFADINLPELMEAGAVDFVAKPLDLDDLLKRIKKAIHEPLEA
jgi:two-component system response regulator HydG